MKGIPLTLSILKRTISRDVQKASSYWYFSRGQNNESSGGLDDMDTEDLEPRTVKPALKALGPMSVAELEEYIVQLEAEIARARDAIKAKYGVKTDAEALFGRKSE